MSYDARTSTGTSVVSAYPMAMLVPQEPYAHFKSVYAGRVLTLIGAGADAHIKLRSRTISQRHAMLLNVDGKLTIRDLSSRTHVYVNGRLVRMATLQDGDLIRTGRITFKLVTGDPLDVPPAPTPPAQLRLSGGQVKPLTGPIFLVGRRRDADLVLRDPNVARAHAVLLEVSGRRFVVQLSPRNPLRLQGHEMKEAMVLPGDVLEIAGHTFQCELAESAPPLPRLSPMPQPAAVPQAAPVEVPADAPAADFVIVDDTPGEPADENEPASDELLAAADDSTTEPATDRMTSIDHAKSVDSTLVAPAAKPVTPPPAPLAAVENALERDESRSVPADDAIEMSGPLIDDSFYGEDSTDSQATRTTADLTPDSRGQTETPARVEQAADANSSSAPRESAASRQSDLQLTWVSLNAPREFDVHVASPLSVGHIPPTLSAEITQPSHGVLDLDSDAPAHAGVAAETGAGAPNAITESSQSERHGDVPSDTLGSSAVDETADVAAIDGTTELVADAQSPELVACGDEPAGLVATNEAPAELVSSFDTPSQATADAPLKSPSEEKPEHQSQSNDADSSTALPTSSMAYAIPESAAIQPMEGTEVHLEEPTDPRADDTIAMEQPGDDSPKLAESPVDAPPGPLAPPAPNAQAPDADKVEPDQAAGPERAAPVKPTSEQLPAAGAAPPTHPSKSVPKWLHNVGPLALAMAAQAQPELIQAPASLPHPHRRGRLWIPVAAAVIVLIAGAVIVTHLMQLK